jgi:hypothetical protein
MELTKKDVALINSAVKSKNKSKPLQVILFILFVIALFAMVFGFLSGQEFIYLAVPLVFLTILLPQLGGSPKYNELVDILEKQLPKNTAMDDILSEWLKKNNEK